MNPLLNVLMDNFCPCLIITKSILFEYRFYLDEDQLLDNLNDQLGSSDEQLGSSEDQLKSSDNQLGSSKHLYYQNKQNNIDKIIDS